MALRTNDDKPLSGAERLMTQLTISPGHNDLIASIPYIIVDLGENKCKLSPDECRANTILTVKMSLLWRVVSPLYYITKACDAELWCFLWSEPE